MVESKIDRVQALGDMKFSDVMAAAFEEDIAKILTEIYTLLVSDDMKVEKKNQAEMVCLENCVLLLC